MSLKKTTNIYIFTFNQNFIKKYTAHNLQMLPQ